MMIRHSSKLSALRPTLLDRYLVREISRAAFAITAVLLLLIAAKLLMQQLGYLLEGKFSAGIVGAVLVNKLLAYFVHMLPFLMLLSAVVALGRMHRDSEMTALYGCGYSDARLLAPLLAVGLPLAALLAALSLAWVPRLSLEAELRHHQARLEAGLDVARPGRFLQAQGGRWALYANEVRDGEARDVFFAVYEPETRQVHIETAARARKHLDAARQEYVLHFEQGRRHSGWPGAADFHTMEFDRHQLRVSAAAPAHVGREVKYWPPARLWAAADPAARAELQWRLSLPVSLLLMLALAVPLARTSVREGKYARAAYAIVLYLVYAQLQLLATSQVRGGHWPEWAGVGLVHLLMALGVALLYHRARAARA